MLKYTFLLLMFSSQLWAEENESYFSSAKQVSEHIWIGPQPTAAQLDELATSGVAAVMNSRTSKEMKKLDFNEAEQLAANGVVYDLIEIKSRRSFTPERLAEFNEFMQANEGKTMVLHCRSGNRASQLYAAWLIKYKDMKVSDALQYVHSKPTLIPDTMTLLLGIAE